MKASATVVETTASNVAHDVPTPVGTSCATFEAVVSTTVADAFIPPDAGWSGGALQLDYVPGHPEWVACVNALAAGKTVLRATIRAGQWILLRGTGTTAVQVGRPVATPPTEFLVQWK